jgi:hypothetical protein
VSWSHLVKELVRVAAQSQVERGRSKIEADSRLWQSRGGAFDGSLLEVDV